MSIASRRPKLRWEAIVVILTPGMITVPSGGRFWPRRIDRLHRVSDNCHTQLNTHARLSTRIIEVSCTIVRGDPEAALGLERDKRLTISATKPSFLPWPVLHGFCFMSEAERRHSHMSYVRQGKLDDRGRHETEFEGIMFTPTIFSC